MGFLDKKITLRPLKTSILIRTLEQLLLLSLVTVVALTTFSFVVAKTHLTQRVYQQLSSIATGKEFQIEQTIEHQREQTLLLTSRREIQETLLRGRPSDGFDALLASLRNDDLPVKGIAVLNEAGIYVGYIGNIPEDLTPSKVTTVEASVNELGWAGNIVRTPIALGGTANQGTLVVHYDVKDLLSDILAVPALGTSGEVVLARENEGNVELLHFKTPLNENRTLTIGTLEEEYDHGSPTAQALWGEESARVAEDYKGNTVLTVYQKLPTFGWSLVVKEDRWEALKGVHELLRSLIVVGLLLLLAAALLAVILARHLTQPLIQLSKKMSKVGPPKWTFRRTIDTGDEVELLDTVAADLTKRLKKIYEDQEELIEERTRELKEEYVKSSAILSSIQHAVVVVDAKGVVTDLNEAACEFLCMKGKEDVVGKLAKQELVFCYKQTCLPPKKHPILRCLDGRDVYRSGPDAHLNLRHKDDSLLPVMLIVTPLIRNRKLLGAVAVFQDMTAERRVDYLKSEFVSLASHQLRTPLSSMQWYIELFAGEDRKALNNVQKESLKEMQKAMERMSGIVESLLSTATMAEEGIKPKFANTDMHELFASVASELKSVAEGNKITCKISGKDQTRIKVETDPILLHVVFQNLISNAIKYSREKSKLHIEAKRSHGYLNVSLSDQGIGIPLKEQNRIFGRLYRASNATKIDPDGNGLGLYISKMIMDVLGGDIVLKSKEGKGSTFTVKIPLKKIKRKKK